MPSLPCHMDAGIEPASIVEIIEEIGVFGEPRGNHPGIHPPVWITLACETRRSIAWLKCDRHPQRESRDCRALAACTIAIHGERRRDDRTPAMQDAGWILITHRR